MQFVKRPDLETCILIVGAILILQPVLATAAPFVFGDEEFRKHLGANAEILEDPTGTLTLDDVLSLPFKDRFAYDDNAELYYGFSQSAYWIRFRLKNASRREHTVYLQIAYPLLESIELFEPTEAGYVRRVAGSSQKPSRQQIKSYDFVFPLVVSDNDINTYYLRIQSNSTLTIPIFLSTKIKYFEYLQTNLMKLGIYYGIILGLMIYNLYIFLAVKDIIDIRRESYLYYVVFLLATATFSLCIDGLGKFLLPEWINWIRMTHVSIDLMLIASAQFSRNFLDTKKNTPILDKFLLSIVFIGFGLAGFSVFGGMHRVGFSTVTVVGPSAVIMILSGIVSWRKGYRPARYFMWAWISWLVLAALYALGAIGLLEFNQPTAQNLVKLGTVFQLLLLSFALGDRINLLHRLLNQEVTERKQAQNQLTLLNEQLEDRVRQRTEELRHSNIELQDTMSELRQAQSYLVESEKMASLGQLVAGVAHEINTPIGVAVTAASHLQDGTEKVNRKFEDRSLRRNDMTGYIAVSQESTKMILSNLRRASALIKNFKQVAVDQSSEEKRAFALKTYIEEVVMSLTPKLKNRPEIAVEIEGDESIRLNSYPGVFSQIISNLIMNSLLHGFSHGEAGVIKIEFHSENSRLICTYRDDGKGIPAANLKKIFDPFFTTKRTEGGSGLGLHIVFNLVTQKLKGKIRCASEENKGITFYMEIPLMS